MNQALSKEIEINVFSRNGHFFYWNRFSELQNSFIFKKHTVFAKRKKKRRKRRRLRAWRLLQILCLLLFLPLPCSRSVSVSQKQINIKKNFLINKFKKKYSLLGNVHVTDLEGFQNTCCQAWLCCRWQKQDIGK